MNLGLGPLRPLPRSSAPPAPPPPPQSTSPRAGLPQERGGQGPLECVGGVRAEPPSSGVRSPAQGGEGRGPPPSRMARSVSLCPLPRLSSAKVFIYPPLLCARPCTRLVKQPSPCPPQASLTNPESEEGGADKETLKRGSKLTLEGRRPFVWNVPVGLGIRVP